MSRKINVVFLAQTPEAWMSVHSVYLACVEDDRFRAEVVLIPCRYPHLGQKNWSWPVRSLLERNRIPFIQGTTDAGVLAVGLERMEPDVIFVPTGYDETKPRGFEVETLARLARLAYVPYGLDIYRAAASDLPKILFDERIHSLAWRVFSRSEGHKRFFDVYGKGSHNVEVVGHPRFDLARRRLIQEDWQDPFDRQATLRLVWAPHWTLKQDGWSTFLRFRQFFLDLLEDDGVQVVMRPHPLLFGAILQERLLTQDEIGSFRASFERSANGFIYEGGGCDSLFQWSNALVTDCSSFLFEYLPTTSPICYTARSAEDAATNEDGIVRGAFYPATSVQDLEAFLQRVRRGEDDLAPARDRALAQLTHLPDGRTGERIRDHLVEQLVVESQTA